ncbi:hypothetical protein EGX44_00335 (plasmid) [Yersinia pseudotuberculosis]|nr:hypothetical protein EGX52_00455 [Yersinia pseudotuberculosis]AYX13751.1 hypothetical protein EGX44_00335 [Yersinia pseudotuberculosis]MBO1564028.1 hypothetical protein [Yersinia pseudotuberculosis]MBO1591704.1 hypothetical protein [Yersinia pseudotuberculosis]MBO1637035.1 hypothetical protein [Yersinia pseudotuberculosis]
MVELCRLLKITRSVYSASLNLRVDVIRINTGAANINRMPVANIGEIVSTVNFIANHVVPHVTETMIKSRITKKFFISILIKHRLRLCNRCFPIDLLISK